MRNLLKNSEVSNLIDEIEEKKSLGQNFDSELDKVMNLFYRNAGISFIINDMKEV